MKLLKLNHPGQIKQDAIFLQMYIDTGQLRCQAVINHISLFRFSLAAQVIRSW